MLESYLFIPSNQKRYIEKIPNLNANNYVFDMEDSVLKEDYEVCIHNLSNIEIKSNYFIRFRLFDENNSFNDTDFRLLVELGFKNFVFPKYREPYQLEIIRNFINNESINVQLKFLLLIEDPMGLLTVTDALKSNLLNIIGIGLGSHDFCNYMEMKHEINYLMHAKQILLLNAKAYGIAAIDTVNINFNDEQGFKNECLHSFHIGFTAKFLIHPNQVILLKQVEYYSKDEVNEAYNVYEKILDLKKGNVAIIKIDGKVYEKPHINRILKIVKWSKDYGN